MRIKNTDRGPRGVETSAGLLFLEAGEERDVDLTEGEAKNLAPYFEEVKARTKKADD